MVGPRPSPRSIPPTPASPRASVGIDVVTRTVLAGAAVAAFIEVALVLVFSGPSFEGVFERLSFFLVELGLFVSIGAATALVAAVVWAILRGRAPELRARLLALMACLPSMYVARAAFSGPRARALPAHDLLVGSVVLVGVFTTYAAVRVAASLSSRLAVPTASRARGRTVVALLVLAAGLHVADQRVLPRLYPFFHLSLQALGLGLGVAIVAAHRAARVSRSRGGTVGALLLALGCAVVGAGFSTLTLARSRALTTVLLDRAPGGSTLARPLLRARLALGGARLAPPPPLAPAEVADALLPPGPRLGSRDVILVTVDALRADRLLPSVMPTVSALAAGGVRFAEAYSQVPHTSFAVATLLTGKHVYSLSSLGLDAASHETLAQIMRRERYKTAAFFPPAVFFVDHERLAPLERSAYGFEYVKYEYLDATHRTDQVIDFFETERPAHAFVWVHYLEPHEPYELHPGITAGTPGGPEGAPERSDAQLRYDGEIRYVDAELARLVAYLRRARPGALLVLAADHGEEFGEHGGRYHGTTLYDEQLRVPLVFSLLDASSASAGLPARVVPDAVGLVDVTPTILALLGVPASAKMRGRDLAPFMSPAPLSIRPRPVYAEIDHKKMVIDGPYKLLCDLELGTCALFDRVRDPGERRDCSGEQPEVTARLRGLLDRFMAGEARFEKRAALPPALARLFARGRLGEAQVAPELVAQLPSLDEETRHDALVLLASLPPVMDARPALVAPGSPEDAALLELVCARGGDVAAQERLARLLESVDGDAGAPSWLSAERAARLALGSRSVPAMARAIENLDEPRLIEALAGALAASGDPRALDALLIGLAPVRSRQRVAEAILALGDPRAVEPLARWLPAEPYVPVRTAMVRVLAGLGQRHAEVLARAREALVALAATEQDGSVLGALVAAIGPGRVGELEIAIDQLPRATPRRERIVGWQEGIESPHELVLADGRVLTPVDGIVRLPSDARQLRKGEHRPYLVLDRPVPPTP